MPRALFRASTLQAAVRKLKRLTSDERVRMKEKSPLEKSQKRAKAHIQKPPQSLIVPAFNKHLEAVKQSRCTSLTASIPAHGVLDGL
jgi:hypothetical protein